MTDIDKLKHKVFNTQDIIAQLLKVLQWETGFKIKEVNVKRYDVVSFDIKDKDKETITEVIAVKINMGIEI